MTVARPPPLDPKNWHNLTLDKHRTRWWTAPSPSGRPAKALFAGLASPAPRQARSKEPEEAVLHPGLTPWMHDWASELNDLLPAGGLDFYDDDIPDDGFSLGAPLEEVNFWERRWLDVRAEKQAAESLRALARARQRSLKRKRSVPLTAAGRRRAYRQRAKAAEPERVGGRFSKKEEIISECSPGRGVRRRQILTRENAVIGNEDEDIAHQKSLAGAIATSDSSGQVESD
ncbi:unnamed protein product [Diplocarpon coronariae]|nr:hypothetical protein JHW43_006062 [Diplocarpon mali]